VTGNDDSAPFAAVFLTRTPDNHAGEGGPVITGGSLAFLAEGDATGGGQPVVVVADHHRLVRQGLVNVLGSQGGCVVTADVDDWDGLAQALASQPSAILVATRLPGLHGTEGIARIRALCPESRIVLLSNETSPGAMRRQEEWGADGLVLENEDSAELIAAIYAVLAGRRHLSPEVVRLREQLSDQALTAREHEVLVHIAAGRPNKAIAREMGISVKTVEKHRDAIMRKLDTHNVTSLLMCARERGWL